MYIHLQFHTINDNIYNILHLWYIHIKIIILYLNKCIIYVDNVYFYKFATGIYENGNLANNIQVYPNPVNAGDIVKFSADVQQVDVFDAAGRLLKSHNNAVMTTEGLGKGLYILKTRTTNGTIQVQKLIVN